MSVATIAATGTGTTTITTGITDTNMAETITTTETTGTIMEKIVTMTGEAGQPTDPTTAGQVVVKTAITITTILTIATEQTGRAPIAKAHREIARPGTMNIRAPVIGARIEIMQLQDPS
jgi:hypothetical protein